VRYPVGFFKNKANMRTIMLHLERLSRHYEASVHSYDEVSLLDLSHSLRVWADLKTVLPQLAPAFSKTLSFKTSTPAKKVLRAARGSRFVFAYMPGGVITYAAQGNVASVPPDSNDKNYSIGASCKINVDGSMELKNYRYVEVILEQPMIKASSSEDVSRCNYSQWLGAEAVRMSYPDNAGDLKTVSITREMLIRRVANTLDGSHPSAAAAGSDIENSYDPAVHYLLQYSMGGLSLPYFILLKIAQDILAIAPKLLGIQPPPSPT